jgi:hydroxypyruvate reductase
MTGHSTEKLREYAREIFNSGLNAVDPRQAVLSHVKRDGSNLLVDEQTYDLSAVNRVFVVGAGKAGASMAAAIEEIMGDKITAGIVNVKYGHVTDLHTIKIHEAGHPIPDTAGVDGAGKIVEILAQSQKNDLVICLISGGGSALLPLPAEGISLSDKQKTTEKLLACGATINEINAVRKHISGIKGGQLARLAAPATLLTLILSDVIGDPLDTIASGPTVADMSTYDDVHQILKHYSILADIPKPVRDRILAGVNGSLPDTPKTGDPVFSAVQNVIIGSNIQAVKAARAKAAAIGFNVLILSSYIEGETKDIAAMHAAIAREIAATGNPVAAPACIISGGETTVTLKGNGKGGRNQEFVLAAAHHIAQLSEVVIMSAGTDGTDGPTDAAGAICDNTTIARARAIGLNPSHHLYNNDAYPFFEKLGDLILTGPTNTNVMDLRIVLVGEQ